MEKDQLVLLTHGDSIDRVADCFRTTAKSSNFIVGIASDKMNLYGVQFHPEVDLTPNGKQMLHNFLFGVAGLTGNYTMHDRESQCIQYIRETVGNNKVLVNYTIYNNEKIISLIGILYYTLILFLAIGKWWC